MGLVQSMYLFLEQSFPPKTKFMVEDIPDLTGKVTIVTGGLSIKFSTSHRTLMPEVPCFVRKHGSWLWNRQGVISRADLVMWSIIISSLNFQALLEHNAKVYVAARSPEKASTAIKKLQQDTGKVAEFLHVDLASLKSVKAAAEEFNRSVFLWNQHINGSPSVNNRAFISTAKRKSYTSYLIMRTCKLL